MKIRIPWDTQSFLILLILSLFLISSFALINAPGPLEWYIIEVLKIDTYKYGILVSLCSWASLLDVFHGYLLDRYLGIILATWIYTVLIIIGCILYCVAGFTKDFWLMLGGRIIFGLGVNPLVLLGNKHIIYWFGKGKYVNFVYSLCESIFWLGSSIIFLVTVPILESIQQFVTKDEAFAITNAGEVAVFTTLTLVPMIIMAYLHKRKENDDTAKLDVSVGNKTEPSIASSADLEQKRKDLKFSDYVCIPIKFWVFSISVFLYYVSILSFISMSILYFETVHNLSASDSSSLSGLISLLPALISPFFGLVLDKVGHNLTSFTTAILLNVLALGLLTWTSCQPLLPVIIMGFSLVTSSGIWSQFQFLVEEHQYMIAYGVAQTGLNGAQAVGTMVAGLIIDQHGYGSFMIFQFSVIVCAVPIIASVWFMDLGKNNFMNMTSKRKNQLLGRIAVDSATVKNNNGIANEAYAE